MPAPLNVDRNAVRVLAAAVGTREAARQTGIPENTVLAWSAREGWKEDEEKAREIAAARVQKREKDLGIVQSSAIKSPSVAMADVLENLSERSKLGFLKASARVAEHLADEPDPDILMARAKSAAGWAKTAALAGGWSGGAGTIVNVAVGLRLEMD